MTKGVIATPHKTASEVGVQVLRDGGNAIDAVIAANTVLCVVYAHKTSVRGDLMAIVWSAGAVAPVRLIGARRSGELATIDAVRSRGHEEMPERDGARRIGAFDQDEEALARGLHKCLAGSTPSSLRSCSIISRTRSWNVVLGFHPRRLVAFEASPRSSKTSAEQGRRRL